MTKRDFFILIIKIYGLITIITTVMSLIGIFPYAAFDDLSENIGTVAWVVGIIALLVAFFLLLIAGAGEIVSKLKLDKGFDDDRIELGNLKAQDIVKIATFIFGGMLIIDNVPSLLVNIYYAFRGELAGLTFENEEIYRWFINVVNIVIGYLLITNYDVVAKRLAINEKNIIQKDQAPAEE